MKMALRQTNQTINIDVRDTVKLFQFVKDHILWDSDFFLNYVKEMDPYSVNRYWYIPNIFPRYIILPDFRYTFIKLPLREEARIRMDNPRIKIENISKFNVFEIIPDESEKSPIRSAYLDFIIDYYKDTKEAKITVMSLEIGQENYGYSTFSVRTKQDDNDMKTIEEALEILVERRGKKIPTGKRPSNTYKKIMKLENSIVAILNFLFTAFTGEYTRYRDSKILEPITALLQSYGNTFEDMLDTIKEVITIIG